MYLPVVVIQIVYVEETNGVWVTGDECDNMLLEEFHSKLIYVGVCSVSYNEYGVRI